MHFDGQHALAKTKNNARGKLTNAVKNQRQHFNKQDKLCLRQRGTKTVKN